MVSLPAASFMFWNQIQAPFKGATRKKVLVLGTTLRVLDFNPKISVFLMSRAFFSLFWPMVSKVFFVNLELEYHCLASFRGKDLLILKFYWGIQRSSCTPLNHKESEFSRKSKDLGYNHQDELAKSWGLTKPYKCVCDYLIVYYTMFVTYIIHTRFSSSRDVFFHPLVTGKTYTSQKVTDSHPKKGHGLKSPGRADSII